MQICLVVAPPFNDAILSFNNYVSSIQANDATCYKSMIDDKKPRMGFFPIATPTNKFIIKSVCIDSPAHKAGLLPNNEVLKIGNTTISSKEDLISSAKDETFGDTVSVEIMRNGIRQIYQGKLPSKEEVLLLKSTPNKGETLSANPSVEEKLIELERLLQKGLITQEEYETKRKQLINGL